MSTQLKDYQGNPINPNAQAEVDVQQVLTSGVVTALINNIPLFAPEGGGESSNAITLKNTNVVYLGNDVFDGSALTYDSNYWSVDNGVISYNGSGSSSNVLELNVALSVGTYIAQMTLSTQNDRYENLCKLQIGSSIVCDPYNGTANVSGTVISEDNSAKFKIIPNNIAFSITAITLCKVVPQAEAVSSIVFNTLNVMAGNSQNTLTDGKWNVAIGPVAQTMPKNVGGSRSIAIGYYALKEWYSGLQNIAIGTFAMQALREGERNISIGADSFYNSKTATDNVAVGWGGLSGVSTSVTGLAYNVAVGNQAGNKAESNTIESVFIGYLSGKGGGQYNTYVGSRTANRTTKVGDYNVAVGYSSLGTNVTGSYNVCLGASSGINTGVNNSIAIGYNVKATSSNQIVIGNSNCEEVVIGGKKIIFHQDGTVTWENV